MTRSKRRFPAKLKFQIVLETIHGEKTAGQIAKAYNVHPNSIAQWKRLFLERGPEVFTLENGSGDHERRIANLEQLLGKKEIEIALLKNFLGSGC